MTRSLAGAVLALLMILGWASPAWAQEDVPAKTTIMGGYSMLVDRSWEQKLPYGIIGALAQRLNETGSVVFEVSGQRGKYGTTHFNIDRWSFLGGFKLQSTGGGEALMPFIQVLTGLSRQAGDVGIQNGFLVQGGGGLDLRFKERFSLRAFADYRFLRERGEHFNQYRVGGGLVYAIRK